MKQSVTEAVGKKVTESIKKVMEGELELLPWQKGWVGGSMPNNPMTGTVYRGTNIFTLNYASYERGFSSNNWVSVGFKKKGARVKYEEWRKNEWVVFFKMIRHENENTGEIRFYPRTKTWKVWNYDQFEDLGDLPIPEKVEPNRFNPHEKSMEIIQDFIGDKRSSTKRLDLRLIEEGHGAFYKPSEHLIKIPPKESFKKGKEWDFPFTIFHELVHSTGHNDLLNRGLQGSHNVDHPYSYEELIAEMGALYLANTVGLEIEFENSVEYLRGWLSSLSMNPEWIIKAGSAAQKAVDLIIGNENWEIKNEEN